MIKPTENLQKLFDQLIIFFILVLVVIFLDGKQNFKK